MSWSGPMGLAHAWRKLALDWFPISTTLAPMKRSACVSNDAASRRSHSRDDAAGRLQKRPPWWCGSMGNKLQKVWPNDKLVPHQTFPYPQLLVILTFSVVK